MPGCRLQMACCFARANRHGVLVGSLMLAMIGLACGPASGLAQPRSADEQARERFEAGRAHYDAGRFSEALVEFEAALELSGRATLLYNIYLCRIDLGDIDRAADALRRYLATAEIEADERPSLQARLAALERRIAERRAVAPERVRSSTPRRNARPRRILDPQPASRGPNVAAWTLVGTGAAAMIAGVVLLAVAQADVSRVENGSRWSEVEGSYDRAPIASGVGFGALGVGLTALGVGVPWLVVGAR